MKLPLVERKNPHVPDNMAVQRLQLAANRVGATLTYQVGMALPEGVELLAVTINSNAGRFQSGYWG